MPPQPKPRVTGLPYGTRGEEGPPATPGTYDRNIINPYEAEGFAHLRPHETEVKRPTRYGSKPVLRST